MIRPLQSGHKQRGDLFLRSSASLLRVSCYDQNVDFYTLLLNNADVRGKIANVFMMEIYNLLGGGKNENVLTAYDYPEMAQMVAEPAVPYGADAPVKKHR